MSHFRKEGPHDIFWTLERSEILLKAMNDENSYEKAQKSYLPDHTITSLKQHVVKLRRSPRVKHDSDNKAMEQSNEASGKGRRSDRKQNVTGKIISEDDESIAPAVQAAKKKQIQDRILISQLLCHLKQVQARNEEQLWTKMTMC